MSNSGNEKIVINKSVLIENCIKQIDEKMNALKLEYMTAWEKNHRFDSSLIDKKLERLKQEKERLSALLNNDSTEMISLDLQQLIQAS